MKQIKYPSSSQFLLRRSPAGAFGCSVLETNNCDSAAAAAADQAVYTTRANSPECQYIRGLNMTIGVLLFLYLRYNFRNTF